MLETLAALRSDSLEAVRGFRLSPADGTRTGIHPEFGEVTRGQLFGTWAAHDLDHLAQVARVPGCRLGSDVGPWRRYLRVIRDPVV